MRPLFPFLLLASENANQLAKTRKATLRVEIRKQAARVFMIDDDFQRLEDHPASLGNNNWQSEGEILASSDETIVATQYCFSGQSIMGQ